LHYKKTAVDTDKRVQNKCGPPGSGKTSSSLWLAVETAKRRWRDLQDDYAYLGNKVRKAERIERRKGVPVPEKLQMEFNEVRDAYEYFKNNDCIPCLYSSIPFTADSRYPSRIIRKHLEQHKRIAAYSVIFIDEIGSMVGVDEGLDKPLVISDFFRLIRHFGDFTAVSTEQDAGNIYIDIRRVEADNEEFERQKWVLKPLVLLLIFWSLRAVFRLNREKLRFLIPLILFMRKAIKYIGFRRYVSWGTGGTESRHTGRQRYNRYYLPTLLNCTYDDRTFREGYRAKDLELEPDIFDSLVLPEEKCALRSAQVEEEGQLSKWECRELENKLWRVMTDAAKNKEKRKDFPDDYAEIQAEMERRGASDG